MKKTIALLVVFLGLIPLASVSAVGEHLGTVQISFDYNRAERDYANNQFAVWIEDMDGNLVKTLFVTRFVATRGWKVREEAVPVWQKKSRISSLSRSEVDAISGATPPAQRLIFRWDGEDANGVRFPAGLYRYCVEANYYWEARVLYRGTIQLGDTEDQSSAKAEYTTADARNYSIVENVSAAFIPHIENSN